MIWTFWETSCHVNPGAHHEFEDIWPEGWDIQRQSWKIGPKKGKLHQFSVSLQSVPLRDTTFAKNTFLSVLEFITKVPFENLSIPLDATNGFPVCRNWVLVEMGYIVEMGYMSNMSDMELHQKQNQYLNHVPESQVWNLYFTHHRPGIKYICFLWYLYQSGCSTWEVSESCPWESDRAADSGLPLNRQEAEFYNEIKMKAKKVQFCKCGEVRMWGRLWCKKWGCEGMM